MDDIEAIALAIAGEKNWDGVQQNALSPEKLIEHYRRVARRVIDVMQKNKTAPKLKPKRKKRR